MSTSKSRKKNTAVPTAERKPAKKTRKGRAGLGMNNTWTDEPPVPETATSVETAEAESPASEAAASEVAPAEPIEPSPAAEPPAPGTEPVISNEPAPEAELVVSKEPAPAPTIEADVPGKKLSAIDAAAKVLSEEGRPMNCQEIIEAMATKGYWQSPGGKTPAATLYSSILREQKVRGAEARFVKAARGKFTSSR